MFPKQRGAGVFRLHMLQAWSTAMAQAACVGLEGGEAGFGVGELPGLVVDRALELQRERGEIGRGEAEQAAERGEAGPSRSSKRSSSGSLAGVGAALRRQALDRGAKGAEAGFGAAVAGQRAGPAGAGNGDMSLYVSPACLVSGAGGDPTSPVGTRNKYMSPIAQAPTPAPSNARRVRLCLAAAMPEGPFLVGPV